MTPLEARELLDRRARWCEAGIASEALDSSADLSRLEPALATDVAAAVFLPGKAQIRNPWHIRALSAAVNDTFTAMTCIDWLGENLCKIVAGWHPARVHRDARGYVRVISAEAAYDRLVQRSFAKIRESSMGMPAIMIRELELDQVADRVRSLLDDPARLRSMGEAMLRVARPDAAEEIAEGLIALGRA